MLAFKTIKKAKQLYNPIDMSIIKLGSSNPKKLAEYQALFPNIQGITIRDLPEVMSDKDQVILYKVKELNQANVIIEDTILEVFENDQWHEIVDIKWQVKNLKDSVPARWIVSLGLMLEDRHIRLYRASLEGVLDSSQYVEDSFGFDSVFIPKDHNETLKNLALKGLKGNISPRKFALLSLGDNKPLKIIHIDKLDTWTGEYQSAK